MKAWQNLTHMATDIDCVQEMKKKFYDTIMGIRTENGKTVYCKYTGYNADYKHHFYTRDDNKIILNQNTDAEVFIPDPQRGLYNTEFGVGYFHRLPYRQHKRGLYSETAIVKLLSRNITSTFTSNNFDETIFDILNESQQQPVSIREACKRATEKMSWAINRNFCVSLSHIENTGFSLFYDTAYIGQVNPEERTIRVDDTLFEQELHDYLRNDPTLWKFA